ncbi:MAG: amidase [Bosea sp.]|uniref:amidase n=1 Tax=unclassified Bosea (in: a-proteobacteria) TaxID=2653178 RepID=UPI00095C067E|nr:MULTISPECIES: amidase [unclassified Bosea (in: a-proteobacteria)]MBN9457651.1 amidase [Bosea sp. (in: a-proteobacteria)]OJV10228.1 MAG: amidase [Bosea sp. 67-29]
MSRTLTELRDDLAAGRTTSVALTEDALARAQANDGEGARVFTKLYAERALQAARASDALRQAGFIRSPLEGLPISIKDLFDVAGDITKAGSVALDDAPPARANAPVVDRLVAAGAVIVGRTNMTEFAFSGLGLNPHYGTPLNPFDRAAGRIPGGSSSGAAVSVSDGMAAAAVGTDTGGSVRIPAALCGLTGFKPTARRVPREGAMPLSTSLDSIGPIARSVACCAMLDAVLSGTGENLLGEASLAGLRLAVPRTVALDGMDTVVAAGFEAALGVLSRAGARISEIDIPEFAQLGAINSKGGFTAAEAWHWHRDVIERAGDRYDPRVRVRILRGREMSAADYIDLLAARSAWIAAVEARIAPFDALVMPTVPVVAPRIDELSDDAAFGATNLLILRNPTFINFLDGCALSVPCHRPGEAPVGLMLAGAAGRDRAVLSIGQAVEQALRAASGS